MTSTQPLPDDLDFVLDAPQPPLAAVPDEIEALPEEPVQSPGSELFAKLRARLLPRGLQALAGANLYQTLSESEAEAEPEQQGDAGPDMEAAVRVEDTLLMREGLRPTDTVLEFGSRTGRLAVRVIPALQGGHYIGIDISASMLQQARSRVSVSLGKPPCRVTWMHQKSTVFPLGNATVDILCCYAAFTHVEPEDVFRYLRNARRIVKPKGKLLFTFLPLTHAAARRAFLDSTRLELAERWTKQRTFPSSQDLMTQLARMAGWEPQHTYRGQDRVPAALNDETSALVGTTIVLVNGEK